MEELCFDSTLATEEIEANFRDIDVFDGIMEGLEETLAHIRSKAQEETLRRKNSLPVICVSEIRAALKFTQKEFADILGVSRRTVEAWETGKSIPTPTAKKLMFLIQEDPDIIEKLR